MFKVIGVVILGIALSFGVVAAAWGIQWVTAPIRGSLDAREQIQADGSFRIAAYDSFFNQCGSIQALEGQLDVAFARRGFVDGTEERRLENSIQGIQGLRLTAINKYNNDAAKSWTEGQFRSSDLPYQINNAVYTGERHTQCSGF